MWDDPDLYELENADDPAFDLGFWTRLVETLRPARMLELACGTGRLTLPLARLGSVEIVGVDASSSFLARARERLAAEPEPVRAAVRFLEGDMRAPAVEGPFDLVAVSFHSLAYIDTQEDRLATLRAARGLLAPGGRFAFDLLAPRYDFLTEALSSCRPVRVDADHAAPELGVERFVRTYWDSYDPTTQTLHSVNRYEIHHVDGRVEHRIRDLDWHMYFPDELELLLAAAGLEPIERHGGYDGEPWGPQARRFLWVCAAV